MENIKFANKIRSSRSLGLIIFLAVMLVTTAGFIVLLAFVEKASGFAILGYIMCGAFHLIALFLLISSVFDYVELDGDTLKTCTLFVRKKAKVANINKITHENNFYIIYVNDKQFTQLNDRDPETQKMLFQFEKQGVRLGEIR